ncbi:MAG: hypothetical protein JSV12_03495 [Candidatus Bathyarchaeota archaeon]|nr:MAG: hypothetical protein JSV12_03495 [Candidatus Bathyarchaeota archaeon]
MHTIGVVLDLPEESAIKLVRHRDYNRLLCNHVYLKFCRDCPQYDCKRRTKPCQRK